jgi:hypothetical protein
VLLATPLPATASLVLTRPDQVLERTEKTPGLTPAFGPKLYLSSGEDVQVYPSGLGPAHPRDPVFLEIALPMAAFGLVLIPFCRRWALLFRLLD